MIFYASLNYLKSVYEGVYGGVWGKEGKSIYHAHRSRIGVFGHDAFAPGYYDQIEGWKLAQKQKKLEKYSTMAIEKAMEPFG